MTVVWVGVIEVLQKTMFLYGISRRFATIPNAMGFEAHVCLICSVASRGAHNEGYLLWGIEWGNRQMADLCDRLVCDFVLKCVVTHSLSGR